MCWIGNVSNIKSGADVKKALDYIVNDKKTARNPEKIIPGDAGEVFGNYVYSTIPMMNVKDTGVVSDSWEGIRKFYDKDKDIRCHHFVQSFDPAHKITPEEAFLIGKDFAEKIFAKSGFDYVVATHADGEVIHNHILVNNVSGSSGMKYHHKTSTYWTMRNVSVETCRQHGINAVDTGRNRDFASEKFIDDLLLDQHGKKIGSLNVSHGRKDYIETEAYQRNTRRNKETMTKTIRKDINAVIRYSTDWNDFVKNMEERGYKVEYLTKSGEYLKNVSYKMPGAGSARRDNKLGDKFLREAICERIEKRLQREVRHQEYLASRKRYAEYRKSVADREYAKYMAMQKRKADKEFDWTIKRLERAYKSRRVHIRLYRVSYMEQKCMLQYERYKTALAKYETSIQFDQKKPSVGEIEALRAQIQRTVDRINLYRKYDIIDKSSLADIKAQIEAEKKKKQQSWKELFGRVKHYDELSGTILRLQELSSVQREYDELNGIAKEVFADKHLKELEEYKILKRELEQDGTIKSISRIRMIADDLQKKMDELSDEMAQLDKDYGVLKELSEEYGIDIEKEREQNRKL